MSRRYTSRRSLIVNALAEKLKCIDGTKNFSVDVAGNVHPRLLFWDEVNEFPAIHLSAGNETREYQGGGYKDRFLTVTVRCYVKDEDPIIEENGRLAYQDRLGSQTTHDILIKSIDTDEGVLSPLGVGEILLLVRY
jgi:hypothetical protein